MGAEGRRSGKRLDQALTEQGLVSSRSQAESWIHLGKVFVDGQSVIKPGYFVRDDQKLELKAAEQYVSRAGLKLASVAQALKLNFKDKVMLDVGSSTGGFTDYALQHGARKVIAVDVGTNQLHPSLRGHPKIELHEQTDIRDIFLEPAQAGGSPRSLAPRDEVSTADKGLAGRARGHKLIFEKPDIVVIDVSFISLREILPHIDNLASGKTEIVAMFKPQFEAVASNLKHKGVIKNDRLRRDILKDFENWARKYFVIVDKADSQVSGAKGNLERFYVLKQIKK